MNLSAFAKYRNVSTEAVRLAIRDGRLKNSVRDVTPAGGKNKKYEIDPEEAMKEWEANTDESKRFNVKAPPPTTTADLAGSIAADLAPGGDIPTNATFKEAQRLDTEYSARLKQLKYEQELGRLVDKEEMQAAFVKVVTEAKTKLLALPSKAKASIPHLTPGDVAVIDRLMREALNDLADAAG